MSLVVKKWDLYVEILKINNNIMEQKIMFARAIEKDAHSI